jgi:hypothetical protein
MPEFHQPDEADRRDAEMTGAAEGTVGDWAERVPLETLRERAAAAGVEGVEGMDAEEIARELKRLRPSSSNDPSSPDRPHT